ncbi:MAG: lysophospholipid acyltransferase family protein [Thermodesulfobacteriota bacterium]
MMKRVKYELGDWLGNLLLTYSILAFRFFPLKGLRYLAKIMGKVAFYLIGKYRHRVISNLFIGFGNEKSLDEIQKLALDVFYHFTLTPLETIYIVANAHRVKRLIEYIKIEGRSYLDEALAKGKGVIGLGAHLGSFTLLGTRLAVEGYPFNILINVGNFPNLSKRLARYQKILGQKPFSPKRNISMIKSSLNCLKRNEILYFIADEQQRRAGIPVPFFGQEAYTPPGPAIFSLKTGAPILPMFLIREGGLPMRLVIHPPVEIEKVQDEKKDVEKLTVQFTKLIEETIRKYPEQWAWLNRRWKLPYRRGSL